MNKSFNNKQGMTPTDLATELWATAQTITTDIGIEGVIELMLPVIHEYTQDVISAERNKVYPVTFYNIDRTKLRA